MPQADLNLLIYTTCNFATMSTIWQSNDKGYSLESSVHVFSRFSICDFPTRLPQKGSAYSSCNKYKIDSSTE